MKKSEEKNIKPEFNLSFKDYIHKYRKEREEKGKIPYLGFAVLILYLTFFLFFDQPLEMLLNNSGEFPFSFFDLLRSLSPFALIAVIVIAISFVLPYSVLGFFDTVLTWLAVCFYAQSMFFNRYIGKINGARYVWRNHPVFTLINAAFWILSAAVMIVFCVKFKKNKDRILLFVKSFLLILGITSFVFTLIKAPKEAFSRRQLYLDGSEQFTVGSKENVIVLIADAVDNSFVKEVMESNPDLFDGFHDFTLYTDTCSVYDLTNTSIPQMFYGYTQIRESDKSIPFLQRFDENGYRMLFYGVNSVRPGSEGYIANYVSTENKEEISGISYELIRSYFVLLSAYKVFPCIFKPVIPTDIIDFNICVVYKKNKQDIVHDNNEFGQKLSLSLNEAEKCFIYQHLDGAHLPCEDFTGETKHCLLIFAEYIRQLQELGVYDNSVIIVASDHGLHDDVDGLPFGVAATPMFMVKKAGESHEKMLLSDKPVYYRDFQATLVRYAGLFDETTDYDLFGKSIDDYPDGEQRTRVWFDESFSSSEYRKYKYTGDTKELERVVNAGEFTEVNSLEYDYSDLDE